jgi:hypothetical protein
MLQILLLLHILVFFIRLHLLQQHSYTKVLHFLFGMFLLINFSTIGNQRIGYNVTVLVIYHLGILPFLR